VKILSCFKVSIFRLFYSIFVSYKTSEVGLGILKMENKGFSFEKLRCCPNLKLCNFYLAFERGAGILISACRTCGSTIFVQPIMLLILDEIL